MNVITKKKLWRPSRNFKIILLNFKKSFTTLYFHSREHFLQSMENGFFLKNWRKKTTKNNWLRVIETHSFIHKTFSRNNFRVIVIYHDDLGRKLSCGNDIDRKWIRKSLFLLFKKKIIINFITIKNYDEFKI